MQVTSLYWRQLYLYLVREQRRQRRVYLRQALRAVSREARLFRPVRIVGAARKPAPTTFLQ